MAPMNNNNILMNIPNMFNTNNLTLISISNDYLSTCRKTIPIQA